MTYLIIIAIYKQKAFISEILKDEEQLIPQHEQKMYEFTFKEHQHLNCKNFGSLAPLIHFFNFFFSN